MKGINKQNSKHKIPNTNKGITLIALVITIIVMLILVAVTISMAVNGGLFDYAGKAVGDTQNAINEEQALASGRIEVDGVWYDSLDDYVNGKISTDQGETAIYAKLYTDGTLILSSTDYTDSTRSVLEDYGDVINKTDYYFSSTPPKIEGDYPGWIDPELYKGANTKINRVIIYDKIFPKKTLAWFSGCSNLIEIEGIENLHMTRVEDATWMFGYCRNLSQLNVPNFDTRNVNNMSYMFISCKRLTDVDIDTRNVINMKFMFAGCDNLTRLDLDTSNVTDMSGMFNACSGLTELDLSKLDTRNVINMSNMFFGCSGLTKLDFSKLDTGNVTDMRCMFAFCSNMTDLDLSGLETFNVTDMAQMFDGCASLKEIDLTNFNTQNVTTYNSMFHEVVADVTIGENWNPAMTESATSYSGTFQTKQ